MPPKMTRFAQMRGCLIAAVVGFAIAAQPATSYAGFWNDEKPQQPAPEIGRFAIVTSQFASRPGLFLLDTTTGQVWELIHYGDVQFEPDIWTPMDKYETREDMLRYLDALNKVPKSTVQPPQ